MAYCIEIYRLNANVETEPIAVLSVLATRHPEIESIADHVPAVLEANQSLYTQGSQMKLNMVITLFYNQFRGKEASSFVRAVIQEACEHRINR